MENTPSRQVRAFAYFSLPRTLGVDHTRRFVMNNTRLVETSASYVVYQRGSQIRLNIVPAPNDGGNMFVDANGWAFSEPEVISLVRSSKLKQLR